MDLWLSQCPNIPNALDATAYCRCTQVIAFADHIINDIYIDHHSLKVANLIFSVFPAYIHITATIILLPL